MMETMNVQHKEEMKSMKQNQTDIQEFENSIERECSRTNQCKGIITDLENMFVVSNNLKKILKEKQGTTKGQSNS